MHIVGCRSARRFPLLSHRSMAMAGPKKLVPPHISTQPLLETMAFESSSPTISVAANYAALWNHWISSSLPISQRLRNTTTLRYCKNLCCRRISFIRIGGCESGREKVWRFGREGSDDLSVEEGAKFRLDLLLRDGDPFL